LTAKQDQIETQDFSPFIFVTKEEKNCTN